jgi:pimeloyl-ACP methyl ester carboxylesterase
MAKKVQRSVRRALDGFRGLMLASGEADSEIAHKLLSSAPLPTTNVVLQALAALVETDLRDYLPMIGVPTLIICGDQDVICQPQASEYMSKMIPGSRLVVFTGCGHVPFIMQNKIFNACLEEFRETLRGNMYRQE